MSILPVCPDCGFTSCPGVALGVSCDKKRNWNIPHPEELLKPSSIEKVNSPKWYTKGGITAIDYIAAKELNFNRGNVIKYVTRAGHKPGDVGKEIEDLEKAKYYLEHEIDRLRMNIDPISEEDNDDEDIDTVTMFNYGDRNHIIVESSKD